MLSISSTSSSPHDAYRLKHSFFIVLGFTLVLWCIKLAGYLLDIYLPILGVNPGHFFGLIGVFSAPLIHGSFEHLIANTPALLVLGTALLYGYPRSWWIVLPVVWFGTGLGVWLTARPVFHFGASGLTYGFMFFIFIVGILRRDRQAIALSLLVFFLYGTMIWGIFPHQPGVSFESHLWGAALGALCALLLRKRDPAPPIKRYKWEDEADYVEDPVIGDVWSQLPEREDAEPKDRIK